MQNDDHFPVLPDRLHIADPRRILESVTSELEALRDFSPSINSAALIELHGALLVYELAGRGELIPSVVSTLSGRRLLEARVALAARRLAGRDRGHHAAANALVRAAHRIEELVHLVDPELAVVAAA